MERDTVKTKPQHSQKREVRVEHVPLHSHSMPSSDTLHTSAGTCCPVPRAPLSPARSCMGGFRPMYSELSDEHRGRRTYTPSSHKCNCSFPSPARDGDATLVGETGKEAQAGTSPPLPGIRERWQTASLPQLATKISPEIAKPPSETASGSAPELGPA